VGGGSGFGDGGIYFDLVSCVCVFGLRSFHNALFIYVSIYLFMRIRWLALGRQCACWAIKHLSINFYSCLWRSKLGTRRGTGRRCCGWVGCWKTEWRVEWAVAWREMCERVSVCFIIYVHTKWSIYDTQHWSATPQFASRNSVAYVPPKRGGSRGYLMLPKPERKLSILGGISRPKRFLYFDEYYRVRHAYLFFVIFGSDKYYFYKKIALSNSCTYRLL